MEAPRILARTGTLWVLAKPAGLAVHPAGEAGPPDLLTWARAEAGALPGLAPVHRLDLETSGVVLYSTDAEERADLGRLFADGAVRKTYLALVHGKPPRGGTVSRPLSDGRRGCRLDARTRFSRLDVFGPVCLVELRPETGRKHQIRRHLRAIGHPIVGDRRYGSPGLRPPPGAPDRLWLHAARLELPDGRVFEAPLAADLAAHLAALRAAPP